MKEKCKWKVTFTPGVKILHMFNYGQRKLRLHILVERPEHPFDVGIEHEWNV